MLSNSILGQGQTLIVKRGGQVFQTFPLTMPILRIGRTPESGLPLPDREVSRSHAELRMEPQGPILTDLGSSNGTFIGNQRLLPNQPHVLADGATFRIGPFLLTYQGSKLPSSPGEESESDTQGLPIGVQDLGRGQPLQPAPRVVGPVPIEISGAGASSAPTTRSQAPRPPSRRPLEEPNSIYSRYLPDIFQEDDFLRRFLHIFEDIWEPLEQRQDHIAMYFDPRTCPVSFLPWLASWLDIPLKTHWPIARQRRLLAQAIELYSWRGTSYGLIRMIEVCTGLIPTITDVPGQPHVFRIQISLAVGAADETVDRALIENLIQTHKPAHVGYILEVLE